MSQGSLFGEPDPPAEKGGSGHVQEIVARYVQALAGQLGFAPPRSVVSSAGARVKDLLDQGIPVDVVSRAAELAALRGLPVSAIDRMVLEAHREERVSVVRNYVAVNGWPTGTRCVRGEQGVSYVRDPLGHDRAPYPVPWGKPSYEEIREALDA